MNGKYILIGHEPKPIDDLFAWGMWFETANRHVADDYIYGVRISTVFLGLDHNYDEWAIEPLLFETMVFGGIWDQYQTRYPTWKEAEEGHAHWKHSVIYYLLDQVPPRGRRSRSMFGVRNHK